MPWSSSINAIAAAWLLGSVRIDGRVFHVAALAAFLLQFFHPFDVTFMDLSVHLVAVGIVVAVSTFAGGFPAR